MSRARKPQRGSVSLLAAKGTVYGSTMRFLKIRGACMWRSMQLAYSISKTYRAIESRHSLSSPVEKDTVDFFITLIKRIEWSEKALSYVFDL